MSKPRILIGSDFSPHSSLALKVAKIWAAKLQAELHVLHINQSKDSTDALAHVYEDESELKHVIDGLQNSLEEKLRKQEADQGVRPHDVINHVTFGKKNEVLRHEVKSLNAKLLVLGCLGQSGLQEIFLGGTTERAIRSIPCPILAVRDQACSEPKKIFWAADLSPRADFVFEWLKIIAEIFKAEVELVMVTDHPEQGLDPHPKLKAYRDQLKLAGHTANVRLIAPLRSSVERALEEDILAGDYDLIVMGTEAKTGLKRFFLGSVAEYLTHHVRRSFFIVKHPDDL